jgi:hypothetical protein
MLAGSRIFQNGTDDGDAIHGSTSCYLAGVKKALSAPA